MKNTAIGAAALSLLLAACGADPAPGPTEQIVVREPGQAPKQAAAEPATDDAPAGDIIATGKEAFAVCSACHAVEADAPAGPGPTLYGVVGRKAASVDGFGFSEALKASGIVWNDAELDAYIADPAAKVPGTTMAAGAVGDAEQRKAIIAYLKTLAG